jgi:hypothetical protein
MLASFPASMLNQNTPDLGILNRLKLDPSRSSRWGDDVRRSDLEPKFTCQVCGHRGGDVRPLFGMPAWGTG